MNASRLPAPLAPICLALLAAIGLSTHGSAAQARGALCSPAAQDALVVEFINNSSQTISFHWIGLDCSEGGGPVLAPGQRESGISYPGHIFRLRGQAEQTLGIFVTSTDNRAFAADDQLIARIAAQGEPYEEDACSPRSKGRFMVEFVNLLNEPITMQWIGYDCKVHVLRKIPAHGRTTEATFPGHVFRFVDSTGRQLRSLDVATDELTYHVSDH